MGRVQDRSADNPALNLYEHLGLSANATAEEIRDSYLTLVRLLHPEQQQDPILRRAAEVQLRRIARAYAILAEPKRRAEYDATLAASVAEPLYETPERRSGPARVLPSVFWLICAIAAIFGIGWYMSQEPSILQSVTPASAANPAQKPASTPEPAAPPPVPPAEPAKPDPIPAGFAGKWSATGASKAPNAPESVEFEIREEQQMLRGEFRVRYQVPDGVPPQDVNAAFAGPNTEAVAILPWAGEHGAGGEIQLRLLSADSLEVTWTTNTGRAPALGLGTMVFSRRAENTHPAP